MRKLRSYVFVAVNQLEVKKQEGRNGQSVGLTSSDSTQLSLRDVAKCICAGSASVVVLRTRVRFCIDAVRSLSARIRGGKHTLHCRGQACGLNDRSGHFWRSHLRVIFHFGSRICKVVVCYVEHAAANDDGAETLNRR